MFDFVDTDATGRVSEEDIESARQKAHDLFDAFDFGDDDEIWPYEPDNLLYFYAAQGEAVDGTGKHYDN